MLSKYLLNIFTVGFGIGSQIYVAVHVYDLEDNSIYDENDQLVIQYKTSVHSH